MKSSTKFIFLIFITLLFLSGILIIFLNTALTNYYFDKNYSAGYWSQELDKEYSFVKSTILTSGFLMLLIAIPSYFLYLRLSFLKEEKIPIFFENIWEYYSQKIIPALRKFILFMLLILLISLLMITLLSPQNLTFSSDNPKRMVEVQILFAVSITGFLGALIREITILVSDKTKALSLSAIFFSTFSGLFVSLISFFLFRAGILKNIEVDTFNVYGVTGISGLTGYFSDRIVSRLSGLYQALIEGNKDSK